MQQCIGATRPLAPVGPTADATTESDGVQGPLDAGWGQLCPGGATNLRHSQTSLNLACAVHIAQEPSPARALAVGFGVMIAGDL